MHYQRILLTHGQEGNAKHPRHERNRYDIWGEKPRLVWVLQATVEIATDANPLWRWYWLTGSGFDDQRTG